MAARATSQDSDLSSLRQQLFAMVGENGGLDMNKAQKAAVKEFSAKFEGLGMAHPEKQELTGTEWNLLFTESEGTSSGKLGPFKGTTLQIFPQERPGIYINKNELFGGFLRLELEGEYSAASDGKIELEFKFIAVSLGGKQVLKKDFPPDFKGFWRCVYADDGVRIFYTNKGNLFMMRNADAGKSAYNWNRYDKNIYS